MRALLFTTIPFQDGVEHVAAVDAPPCGGPPLSTTLLEIHEMVTNHATVTTMAIHEALLSMRFRDSMIQKYRTSHDAVRPESSTSKEGVGRPGTIEVIDCLGKNNEISGEEKLGSAYLIGPTRLRSESESVGKTLLRFDFFDGCQFLVRPVGEMENDEFVLKSNLDRGKNKFCQA